MSVPPVRSRPISRYAAGLRRTAGVLSGLVLLVPLGACGGDEPPAPAATSAPPATSEPPIPPAPSSPPASPSAPSEAASDSPQRGMLDALGAVAAAEAAIDNGTVVEVSKDDDNNQIVWDTTVRVGDAGRELRISASDGSVLRNEGERLSAVQSGTLPPVTVDAAITTAQQRVPEGEVTDVELNRENRQAVWEVSVDVTSGNDYDLLIDASSGDVIRQQRD